VDYRGNLKFRYNKVNSGVNDYEVGERVGQIVFVPSVEAVFVQVDKLDETVRGEGGFGSTGV